jgi:hypothetical protein
MFILIIVKSTNVVSAIPTFQPQLILLFFHTNSLQEFKNSVTKKRGCRTKQQIGRSDVPTRNLVLCDPKTNQHIQIFPSESSKALLPTTTDHFTQTSLTLAQKQQILIIESELTPSFIKGPESTDILAARHTSKDKHTSALMLFNCSCKSFLTVQLNCWRSGKVQQLARAKDLFYCLSVHLYVHLPSSALLLAIAHPVSKKNKKIHDLPLPFHHLVSQLGSPLQLSLPVSKIRAPRLPSKNSDHCMFGFPLKLFPTPFQVHVPKTIKWPSLLSQFFGVAIRLPALGAAIRFPVRPPCDRSQCHPSVPQKAESLSSSDFVECDRFEDLCGIFPTDSHQRPE